MTPTTALAVLRRSAPTVALLFGASALLLLTDRQSAKRALPAIAVLQQTSSPVLEDTIKGMITGLTERGFVDGKTVTIRRYNAEGDIAQGNAIAREIVGGPFDLVVSDGVLHLIAVPVPLLAEKLAGDLRPGGVLVATLPVAGAPNRVLLALRRLYRRLPSSADRLALAFAMLLYRDIPRPLLRDRLP